MTEASAVQSRKRKWWIEGVGGEGIWLRWRHTKNMETPCSYQVKCLTLCNKACIISVLVMFHFQCLSLWKSNDMIMIFKVMTTNIWLATCSFKAATSVFLALTSASSWANRWLVSVSPVPIIIEGSCCSFDWKRNTNILHKQIGKTILRNPFTGFTNNPHSAYQTCPLLNWNICFEPSLKSVL